MAIDTRPDFGDAQSVMGVAGVIRRPEPDSTPIDSVVVWLTHQSLLTPDQGMRIGRREPSRTACISRVDVPTVPRGTILEAPEFEGADVRRWKVEALEAEEYDHVRARVILIVE